MTQSSRTFRIFVSSTFSDLKAERNALQEKVFPRLKELAESHGCRFQAVDLRWGVSEEAALDQQAMKICLGEIERCQKVTPRPNFIILLGNRYGWRPLPLEIPAEENNAVFDLVPENEKKLLDQWYLKDENSIPPVYTLQPRTGEFVSPENWKRVETRLHETIEKAAHQAGLAEAALIKYVTSATEQEIINGAIQVVNAREHIFCFTREIDAIPSVPFAKDYLDLKDDQPDEQAASLLTDLKIRLKAVLGNNYREYPARWLESGPSQEHIDQFCQDVYDRLSNIILSEIEHPAAMVKTGAVEKHIRTEPTLDNEGLAHHAFAEERLRFFVGRTEMLARIADYVSDSQRRSLGIVGEGGSGKSALMAKAIEKTQQGHPGAEIVYRFIGATPASSDGRSLMDGLCREIARRYGTTETDIPVDYRDLVPELGKRMQLATAEKPLILFLDSLDQLSTSQGARSLIWIPNELPEHVAVIASTRAEDVWENLKAKSPRQEVLGGLSKNEGNELLDQWLADISRNLQPAQATAVLEKFEASRGNPLYLKLAFEEARLWTSYAPQESLATSVGGIIKENMIDRLMREGSHGEVLVSHALGYLAASRFGLAEDELVELLSRDVQVYEWFFKRSYHLPSDLVRCAIRLHSTGITPESANPQPDSTAEQAAIQWLNELRNQPVQTLEFLRMVLPKSDGPSLPVILWSRLYFDLAPYLTERLVDGSALLNFYHRELGDVSKSVFLADGEDKLFHERLADYFRHKADPLHTNTWDGRSLHGLSELPYHLTQAGLFEQVYQTLIDFKFLEHKAAEVGVLERKDEDGNPANTYTGVLQLQEDYERALAAMLGGEGRLGERAPLILTALETSQGLMVYCPVCNKASSIQKEMLDTVISCPTETCKAPIKLNPFTVKREY